LESEFIGTLNDIALELGFDSEMMQHNGIKNQYINIKCRFCSTFQIQVEYEKIEDKAINIKVKRMFHGWRHDFKNKHDMKAL
jgi:hypothetical protein